MKSGQNLNFCSVESGGARRGAGRRRGWREGRIQAAPVEKGAAALRVSPGEVEAEEGFAELALLQQVLQQRGETADGNAGVSQAQNPVEVQVVEGSAGLVQAQAELLVPEDDVLDLEGEGRCWEMSGFGGKIKSALGEAELFPIARGVGSSLTPSFVPSPFLFHQKPRFAS